MRGRSARLDVRAGAGLLVTSAALAAMTAAADNAAVAYPDGAATFQANCVVCHGAGGVGTPALAPPLTSYPARYAGSDAGRRQLANTVLYGMFGDITVEGKAYSFKMPDFARLDDATLAGVLNYVVFDLGHAPADVKPLVPADIAAARATPLDGAAVREQRKGLAPGGS